ncbi:hypothetical protein LTR62_007302 [Meristemomyces frigidus]|uniref:UBX domain-containing protein n=1 Tax=Meristemomyces frigidus TaxID=1508187 RepID=A0AAN7YIU2_9PEZI|nr:hypothetical protein LTR62_007302 [Meristemomyces frigidus]
MAGDLDTLVDMGFDREKSEHALKKGGNLTGAIDWLDKNASKSMEDIKEDQDEETAAAAGDAANPSAQAMSMVCNDCGRKLRNMAGAQFHAEKTGHDDFSESTEEIAPLTEEEKKQKLAELKEKAAAKKAGMAKVDEAERKRNDEIRKKTTKESDDAKEALRAKQQIKEAQAKRQEKLDDVAAKKRIKDKIEADKAARRQKQEAEKAMRENPEAYNPGAPTASTGGAAAVAEAPKKAAAHHSEARLRLQTAAGNVMKTFGAETTLFEVVHALEEENGTTAQTLTMNMPRKTFDRTDFGLTLKEAGLVPSAVLIVK